jgi:hypothetical protein
MASCFGDAVRESWDPEQDIEDGVGVEEHSLFDGGFVSLRGCNAFPGEFTPYALAEGCMWWEIGKGFCEG